MTTTQSKALADFKAARGKADGPIPLNSAGRQYRPATLAALVAAEAVVAVSKIKATSQIGRARSRYSKAYREVEYVEVLYDVS